MKQKLKNLIAKAKSHKQTAALGAAILALLITLAVMLVTEYGNSAKNISKAAAEKQLVLIDLATGKEIDAELLTGKKPPEKPKGEPKQVTLKSGNLSVIIGGLGLNESDSNRAVSLPPEFILSFSPYGEQSLELSKKASEAGHVTLADLPMQFKDSENPAGNFALVATNNDFRNMQNLRATLSKIFQADGVVTPPDEIFSKSSAFHGIMQELAKRHKYVIYSAESEVVDTAIAEMDIEVLKPDIIISHQDNLKSRIEDAEKMATSSGYALVFITNADSATLETLEAWVPTLAAKNIKIIATGR